MGKKKAFLLQVDSESFPLVIESRPEFASLAFSPAERYTMQELAQLANYSAARGVRLVIEIDLPGHTGYGNDISPGWCLPFPETCPKPRCQRDNDLNPAANLTYVPAPVFKTTSGVKRLKPPSFFDHPVRISEVSEVSFPSGAARIIHLDTIPPGAGTR